MSEMSPQKRIRVEFWRLLRNGRSTLAYRREQRRLGRPSLTAIMDYHGSDKGSLHGYGYGLAVGHGYTAPYDSLLSGHRDRPVTMLEIGIGPKQPGVTGAAILGHNGRRSGDIRGSITGWREYFPRGEIHALDLLDCRELAGERLTIHVADQSSRSSLESVVGAIGRPLDVVIDDGSHASAHQQITLASLLPHLAEDGVYLIEDLQWQPPELEGKDAVKTIDLLRALEQTGKFPSPVLTKKERLAVERSAEVLTIEEGLGAWNAAFAALTRRSPESA